MTSEKRLNIRLMSPDEIGIAVDWAAKEGWNPGLSDLAAFASVDAEGFLLGTIDAVPVSCISVVRYPGDFAFLGFYIVRPEDRGKGYGWATWQAGMTRLKGCNVGLDGVTAQQENYRKSGFTLAHRNIRFGGRPTSEPDASGHIVNAAEVGISAICAYDRICFPAPREEFLRLWCTLPGHVARICLKNGEIKGFGVIRPCREGFKVGPLFAESADIADSLFMALAAEAKGDTVYLDVPEPNPDAVALAERHGMAPVFETARMYTKGDPGLPLKGIFGITSFELG